MRGDGEVVGFDRQAADSKPFGQVGKPGRPAPRAIDLVEWSFGFSLFDVAKVGDEDGVGSGDQQVAGRPGES